jgi:hypothetical protein
VKKRGLKKQRIAKMYLLDRSTCRRIGDKEKRSHVATLNALQNELKHFPTPLSFLKKIFLNVVTSLLSTASILRSKEGNIVNIWPLTLWVV